MWRCPLCHSAFQQASQLTLPQTKTWVCANGHHFDKAKQGYVNLLPVQHKRSKEPGDDKVMVQARHAFLSQHYYANIVDTIAAYLDAYFKDQSVPISSIYDAGCGTGYYINALKQSFKDVQCSGHDISKNAVICAAKHYKDLSFSVASTINIPVVDHTQNVIIQVFSPECDSEYARIIDQQGVLVTVDPGPQHLAEMKAKLYDTPLDHEPPKNALTSFTCIDEQSIVNTVSLNNNECAINLLKMTPYYWRASDIQKADIYASLTSVTTHFILRFYTKNLTPTQSAEK